MNKRRVRKKPCKHDGYEHKVSTTAWRCSKCLKIIRCPKGKPKDDGCGQWMAKARGLLASALYAAVDDYRDGFTESLEVSFTRAEYLGLTKLVFGTVPKAKD